VSAPGREELGRLAALLRERVGLHLRPDGHAALRIAWRARYEDPSPPPVPPEEYLSLLRSPEGEEEVRRLLPLVTVGKTDFYRDEGQFAALRRLLPGLLAASRAEGRPLAVWSAGCATGEEPYTIAMEAAEAGAAAGELELLATDVNPEAVARAMAGRYPARRLDPVPPELRDRYFEPDGDHWVVGTRLRGLLSGARVHNLVGGPPPRPLVGAWDVVFCRNVIIYFDTPTAQRVLAGFLAGLGPGGWLFLGYSESLFRMFDGFDLEEVAGTFLYRRPAATPAIPEPPGPGPARWAPHGVRHAPPARGTEEALSSQELLDATVQLCGAGRFQEARRGLERHLGDGEGGLALRLTLANLLGILQEHDAAAARYREALHQEPLSAEAHLFCGIHLLGLQMAEAAAEELTRALFLDPDCAAGHYFLGRCREAQGDQPRARLAYRNAVEAVARQPSGRSHPFVGFYPDLPEDGLPFARAAEYALAALAEPPARA